MNTAPNNALVLEHQCPQCGAPITISETTRLVLCPFCKVRHYIDAHDYLCSVVLPADTVDKSTCGYVPYWRLRGIEYVFNGITLQSGFIDATMCALDGSLFPLTLGYRLQTARLKFALPQTTGTFYKPKFDKDEFVNKLTKQRTALNAMKIPQQDSAAATQMISKVAGVLMTDANSTSSLARSVFDGYLKSNAQVKTAKLTSVDIRYFIGETISLIYYPVFAKGNRLVDAAFGNEFCALPATEPECETSSSNKFPFDLLPTLCPNCGSNMTGASDSLALACPRCESVWQPANGAWKRLDFSAAATTLTKADLWLPFWKMKVQSTNVPCASFADLIRVTNFPKPLIAEYEAEELFFRMPALRMEAEKYLLFGKVSTVARMKIADVKLPAGDMYPVTMPVAEAKQAIIPLLISMMQQKKNAIGSIDNAEVDLKEYSLVYVPFVRRNFEYVQPEMNVAVHVNMLKWAAVE